MMRPEFELYFLPDGRMAPHGMNDIVYSTEFLYLGGELSLRTGCTLYITHEIFESYLCNSDMTRPISHDNLTALSCLSLKLGFSAPKFSPEHAYWHPRDFFFYAYMNGTELIKTMGFLFSWVTSICMIYSILFDSYKTINGQQVLATDGKLLTFLVINTGKYNLTKAVCEFILRRKGKKFADYFLIYFGDKHPNYILAKEKDV